MNEKQLKEKLSKWYGIFKSIAYPEDVRSHNEAYHQIMKIIEREQLLESIQKKNEAREKLEKKMKAPKPGNSLPRIMAPKYIGSKSPWEKK